jgi:WD40 repeat protein
MGVRNTILLASAIATLASCGGKGSSLPVVARLSDATGGKSVLQSRIPLVDPTAVLGMSGEAASPLLRSFVASPNAAGPFVYGCAYLANACVWFKQGSDEIAGEIAGLNGPEGLGVDPRNGDLYIANAGGSDIRVYAPNSTTMLADYGDPGESPVDVAVDADGSFYVANILTSSGHPGSVSVYDASGKRLRIISDKNVYVGISVSIDEHHLLSFCFNNFSYLGECDDFKGAREPGMVRASGWNRFSGGGGFDTADHLVVIDQAARHVLTFDGSTECGRAKLDHTDDAFLMALGRDNRLLFVSDPSNGSIKEYPFSDCENGSVARRMVYWTGLHQTGLLVGVAVTPSGGP